MSKKDLQSHLPAYPDFLRRVLSQCQAQPYSQELPSSVLANWQSNTANKLCTAKPANKGELGASAIKHAKVSYREFIGSLYLYYYCYYYCVCWKSQTLCICLISPSSSLRLSRNPGEFEAKKKKNFTDHRTTNTT